MKDYKSEQEEKDIGKVLYTQSDEEAQRNEQSHNPRCKKCAGVLANLSSAITTTRLPGASKAPDAFILDQERSRTECTR